VLGRHAPVRVHPARVDGEVWARLKPRDVRGPRARVEGRGCEGGAAASPVSPPASFLEPPHGWAPMRDGAHCVQSFRLTVEEVLAREFVFSFAEPKQSKDKAKTKQNKSKQNKEQAKQSKAKAKQSNIIVRTYFGSSPLDRSGEW